MICYCFQARSSTMISDGPQTNLSRQQYLNPCCLPISIHLFKPQLHKYTYTFPVFRQPENMDESWRTPFGTTATKQPNNEALDPEDFDDVFGGPPRSVLSRQYSVEGNVARNFVFEDIFRKRNKNFDLGGRSDRTLPEFRIPESKTGGRLSEEEFYSDIFGNSRRSRSRSVSQTNSNSKSKSKSKSKSNSSSILSSEELSPFRPPVIDDDDVTVFAAKLRPINVSSKWNKSKKMHEVQQMPDSPCNFDSFEGDNIHKFKGCYSGFSKMLSSPEITTFKPNNSYTSVNESTEDLQVNSPASVVTSFNQDQRDEKSTIRDDDDEVMSSFVIEINSSEIREKNGESHGLDEAIAWVTKQKCKSSNLEKELNKREDDDEHEFDKQKLEKQKVFTTEEPLQEHEKDMELELLDEDIKLWSDGKEPNIRLLLSTLHHILWPTSGWIMIPITELKDSSNVKKVYQKARLCLHPDKLQQRGATISQKYVAEKAFPILQDAWAAFISQDACSPIR